jgi:hypothetical protein
MINVPEAFFKHDFEEANLHKNEANKWKIKDWMEAREDMFRRFYETMGSRAEDDCFYHFISSVPTHSKDITHVFVCFRGFVQYKAIVVEFLKDKAVMLPSYEHPTPRDWVITTGPVVKAPAGMVQKGFRGFRYCDMLF